MQHHAVEKLDYILCPGIIRPVPSQVENIEIVQEHIHVYEDAGNSCHCKIQRNEPHLHTQEDEHTVNCNHLLRPDSQVQRTYPLLCDFKEKAKPMFGQNSLKEDRYCNEEEKRKQAIAENLPFFGYSHLGEEECSNHHGIR